jgi:hypothetical protein
MKFHIPKDGNFTALPPSGDSDMVGVVIGFTSDRDSTRVRWETATSILDRVPFLKLIGSPNNIQEREIVPENADRIIGVDFAGCDKKGRKWRWVAVPFEAIGYDNVSNDAASYFDAMIDKMCWDASAWSTDR